jgi:hypothetical protein
MRRVSAFLRRHLAITLAVLVLLAVAVVLWIFSAAILGGGLLILALIWALIWLPKWQGARPDLTAKERFEVENDARKTLAEIVGGAALLVALYFTWSSLEVSREGQVTERFTRAIDQLGNEKLDIRLGGIYALERIARDSERDHWPIMEILTTYVRAHAPWPPKDTPLRQDDQSATETPLVKNEPASPKPAADIQAILTVLGRRTRLFHKGEDQSLDLAHTDLRGARPWGAHLEGANLRGTHLEGAELYQAHLVGAKLWSTDLRGAWLSEAHLTGAELWGAHLAGAFLYKAHLERVGLNVELLATVRTLYRGYFDPPLREQIEQQYPRLLEKPQNFAEPLEEGKLP